MEMDSISLKSRLLNWPASFCPPSITNKGVPMLRIWMFVADPGRPSVCRKLRPGILPTKAPDVVDESDRLLSSELMDDIAPVSASVFCARPHPVTTTSSHASAEDVTPIDTLLVLAPTRTTSCS